MNRYLAGGLLVVASCGGGGENLGNVVAYECRGDVGSMAHFALGQSFGDVARDQIGQDGHPEIFSDLLVEFNRGFRQEGTYRSLGDCAFTGVRDVSPWEFGELNGTFTRLGYVVTVDGAVVLPLEGNIDGQTVMGAVVRYEAWHVESPASLNSIDDNGDFTTK